MITPYFRYEGTSLDWNNGVYAPVFPIQRGLSFHTYVTEKPLYTVTGRNYGTTQFNLACEGLKKADRDTVLAFWHTTLLEGYNSFTAIDNRSRMLFETNWNQWRENWRKERGGIYNIPIELESGTVWTPPVWGAYLMADDTLDNHNLQGNNLAAVNGTMVDHDTDGDILRQNGSALRITGDTGTVITGASGAVSFQNGTSKNNVTLFCQFMTTAVLSEGRVYLINLEHGTSYYRIAFESENRIYGMIANAGTGVIRKGASTYHTISVDTWYDVAITYDAVNDQNYIYVCASGVTSFTDFLSGLTDTTDQIGTYGGISVYDGTWTSVKLLNETTDATVIENEYVYVQNPMIFNGFISPMEFNNLRRLCYLWNNKTEVYPK